MSALPLLVIMLILSQMINMGSFTGSNLKDFSPFKQNFVSYSKNTRIGFP